jgi:L-rhamnose mutarotase
MNVPIERDTCPVAGQDRDQRARSSGRRRVMTRVAWTAALRPEKVDAYVEAHANVWPDVLDAIRAAGIRDYSIWLWQDRVFAQYETDDHEGSLRIEAAAEATQRWRALMREYFAEDVTTVGVTWLEEIFRLE